ncbi:MAG: porin [Oxalobacter sp.]|nr:porin [Oxalobacter sp.]
MKKTLIALAVLGAASGVAYAQTNVTIYGVVDTGYVKKTGQDLNMEENVNNRIGFKGVEDLGGGLKATFQLERRFDLADGRNKSNGKTVNGKDHEWDGGANVGIKSDDWGWVRMGRMNGIATENIRKFDPFYQYGVGGMIDSTQRGVRRDRMLRYDSPEWAGFSFQAAYELGRNMNDKSRDVDGVYVRDVDWDTRNGYSNGWDNDGYQLGLNYKYGGFAATANYQMLADSNRSTLWNVGASYSWDTVKVEALYQYTKDKIGMLVTADETLNPKKAASALADDDYVDYDSFELQQALLGLEWKLGPGRLNASVQWLGVEGNGNGNKDLDEDVWKAAVGYTYNLSKRTSLYGIVAYTDWGSEEVGDMFDGIAQDSTTAVQLGITHKF